MKHTQHITVIAQGILALFLGIVLTATAVEADEVTYYISAGGGWASTADHDFNTGPSAVGVVSTELDDGYGLFGAIGAAYADIRGEVELSWRSGEVDGHKLGSTSLPGAVGDAETLAGMVNIYYDIPTDTELIPYVGAGIGLANVSFEGYTITGVPNVLDDDDTVFAYQLIAGLGYRVSEDVTLQIDYRYFATADPEVTTTLGSNTTDTEYENHAVFVGLRYGF